MGELIPFVREFGLPMLIIFVVARWLAPRFDRVLDTHIDFVKSLKEQVTRQTDIQERQSETMTLVVDNQKQHSEWLKDIHTASKHFSPVVVNTGPTTVQAPGKKSDPVQSIVVPT